MKPVIESDSSFLDDKFHDECAVIGVMGPNEAANFCYLGLYAMQHRGQEGAGIVSSDGKTLLSYRDMGLVADIFDERVIASLVGNRAIGHTRYATFGGKNFQNLQPLMATVSHGSFAVAHNGNLINAHELRRDLEKNGAIFSTTSDTEVILHLIVAAQKKPNMVDRIVEAVSQVKGAYSLVILTRDSLYGVRDPNGLRPLSLATIDQGHVLASETCAFDLLGATFLRDVEPGEIVEIAHSDTANSDTANSDTVKSGAKSGTVKSHFKLPKADPAFCIFEYIYFARPDSNIAGRNVYQVRKDLGAELAREHPATADLVIPVPDSGVPAAIGYAMQAGLPMEFGLIRNHYVGRTFIEPKQSIRDFGVKIKLNPNRELLQGKRVVVVDDSIVRGTTSKKIVAILRQAGAKEVHVRVSSPPTTGPCHYGIDTPSKEELIASSNSVAQICEYLGADSLGYLSSDGMYRAVTGSVAGNTGKNGCGSFCDACFSGNYRIGEPSTSSAEDVTSTRDLSMTSRGLGGRK